MHLSVTASDIVLAFQPPEARKYSRSRLRQIQAFVGHSIAMPLPFIAVYCIQTRSAMY
ncbi:MAG: hypothetical protein V7K89_28030 [Nostoc sp.]|uniref:hypothetical protein n=1 Tax=Nostoc sp. TaxID=1180 RepID=UPI002FFC50F6